jgi:hypothetical protein
VDPRASSQKGLLVLAAVAAVVLLLAFLLFGDAWSRWFPER